MSQIIIPSDAPASVVVLHDGIMETVEQLVSDERNAVIRDAVDIDFANGIYRGLKNVETEIETARKAAVAPFNAVTKAINDAASTVVSRVKEARDRLGKRMLEVQQAIQAKAKAEAEERAKAERERIAAEAAEAALLGSSAPEPAPVVAAVVAPVIPRLAVRQSKRKVLKVVDEKAIPLELNGVRLWKRDEVAIKKLMELGVPVPGCELVVETGLAAMP